MELTILFLVLLLCVAFLYASVGHGGASGYLALMAIFSVAPEVMKPTALLLNLFVSVVAFVQFYRGGHFNTKLFLPFALASIPFSFIGGLIVVDGQVYKHILGLLLLVPIVRFLAFRNGEEGESKAPNIGLALFIGSIIGFLSGLIGIGGGILLSPVILLLGWAGQKQTASVSALFIFVNSLAGLGGQLVKGVQFSTDMYLYVAVAFAGGLGGAYYGSMRLPQQSLKRILALVLLLASYKLLFTGA
ncbi:sulfite exporter TauE/SafE family protein [Paracnuella aquatica]|uniref:sulfite exporter TauE/SafE family protein n=1 Tax=Paracnuella aquatica TaxID=2268757 RepID=UPI000DEEBBFB|nr:sulfite exporter TauE/SafE family protein [Paracnuella aquatica]RPD49195.1 sulfite exporter TauE/SafE family protein [Paracnuella aquatica]